MGFSTRCLDIIRVALEEAGAGLRHVVRTTVYLTSVEASEGVGRAHAEAFREVRPASTMVVVDRLLDPHWMVEISADAVIHDES